MPYSIRGSVVPASGLGGRYLEYYSTASHFRRGECPPPPHPFASLPRSRNISHLQDVSWNIRFIRITRGLAEIASDARFVSLRRYVSSRLKGKGEIGV